VQEVWPLGVTFGLPVGAGVSPFYMPRTDLAMKWLPGQRAMAVTVVTTGHGLGMLPLAPRGMGLGSLAGGESTTSRGPAGPSSWALFAIGTMAIVLGLTVRAPGFVGGRPNRAVGG